MKLKQGAGSGKIAIFILILVLAAVTFWVLLSKGCLKSQNVNSAETTSPLTETLDLEQPLKEGKLDPSGALGDPFKNANRNGIEMDDPLSILAEVARSIRENSVEETVSLIGKNKLTPPQVTFLENLSTNNGIELAENPIREIGEIEVNNLTRWALKTTTDQADLILDLRKKENGKWTIERVSIPQSIGNLNAAQSNFEDLYADADALTVADGFVRALLDQDFEKAKKLVNLESISDARIAGLCIIFEEGNYQLRKKKPLRSLFIRDTAAGFMANIIDPNGKKSGQFALTLQKESEQKRWEVAEINLDELLSDYITRVAEGDSYYTPIVKNPEGGDTLALYFDFNDNELTPRAKRQLQIVSNLLTLGRDKKMTLSGHADAIGSEEYNDQLSLKRAKSVKEYLMSQGVADAQIQIIAFGESKPRRSNSSDKGRRANRRTEIYLNF